jgi:glycyl-tRNA synthetase alpha chain
MSLKKIGVDIYNSDIKFVEDNWSSPTLGASGVGWEIRLNGAEVTQFTYFQQMGGLQCFPVMVEIAYGLERLALHIQHVDSMDDIIFDINNFRTIKYSDIFKRYEQEYTKYLINELNFNQLDLEFNEIEKKINNLLNKNYTLMSYDYLVKLAHIFNLIDSNVCYGFARQKYIYRIKTIAKKIAIQIRNEK